MGHYNLGEGWRRIRSHISKSVAVLLCSGLLVTSALGTVSAQTITIKEKDATLHQVLEKSEDKRMWTWWEI